MTTLIRFIALLTLSVAIAANTSTALADGPYEPNETEDTARALPLDGVVSAGVETDTDEDYFFFYARETRQVRLQLANRTPSNASCSFTRADIGLEGLSFDRFLSVEYSDSPSDHQPVDETSVTVNKGERYAVSIDSFYCAEALYTFSVSPSDAISDRPVASDACVAARASVSKARQAVSRAKGSGARARGRAARRRAARALDRSRQKLRGAEARERGACA